MLASHVASDPGTLTLGFLGEGRGLRSLLHALARVDPGAFHAAARCARRWRGLRYVHSLLRFAPAHDTARGTEAHVLSELGVSRTTLDQAMGVRCVCCGEYTRSNPNREAWCRITGRGRLCSVCMRDPRRTHAYHATAGELRAAFGRRRWAQLHHTVQCWRMWNGSCLYPFQQIVRAAHKPGYVPRDPPAHFFDDPSLLANRLHIRRLVNMRSFEYFQ